MKIIYLHDACHALGIDSATLYRWLKRAQMEVHTDEVDKRKRYITQADVRKLARLHGKQLSGSYHADAMQISEESGERITQLEYEIAELKRRVDELERQKPQPRIVKPAPAEYGAIAPVQKPSSLPDGQETLASFAERHGIKSSTYKRWAKDEAKLKTGRGGKYYASQEVAEAFYEKFHTDGSFQERECCPHSS